MDNSALILATLVMAIATVVAAIAAIASASYARKAVNEQQANFVKQLEEYRLSLFAQTTLKFEEKFNDLHFKQIRSIAAGALLNKRDEEEAEDVFDFFETVGLFVKLGALTEGIAYSVFFHWINLYWKAGRRHIAVKRQDAESLWGDFETLYNRVCEIEKQTAPDSDDLRMQDSRLNQQLQDEVDIWPRT
jgi:hypothetical protein